MQANPSTRPSKGMRTLFLLMTVAASFSCGCGAISQDVHRYYRQMAINYKEAEDKAKLDAMSLEGQSRVLMQTGDFRNYNHTQKELARIKGWESQCARQRERFEKAAETMERSSGTKAVPAPEAPPAS